NTPLNNNTVNNTTPISLSYTLCPFYIISSYTYIINNTYKSITPIIPYHISCYYIEICKYLHLIEPLIYYLEYISKYLDVKIEEIIDIFIEIVQDIDKWYGDSIGVGVGGVTNLSDEQQGVSDRGSDIKGVSNMDSNIKGVGDRGSNIKGVGDKDSKQQGVNITTNKQQGVSNISDVQQGVNITSNKQQGVNIFTNKQQGVSNNTDEQHPFNNATNEQHPFNNTTTNITTTNHSLLLTLLSLPLNILYTLYTKCKKKEHFISKYENVYNKYIRITSSLPDKYYILLIKYIVYNDSSDKGDSTNTLHPVNAGTNNYNPLNTTTNALPPVNTSTNNYNPLNNNTVNNTPLTTQHTNNTPSILLSNNTFYLWFLFLIIDRNCFRIKGVLNEVCIIFKGNINYMSYLIEKVVELRLTGVLCTFIKEWRLSVISVLDKCVKEDVECIDSSVIDVIERYIFKYCSVEECMLEGDRVVEGVSDKSMLEGVNHKGSDIEGVRDKSMLEGVNHKDSDIKGGNDTIDERQGVNDKGKEEGVNHKGSDIKGVGDTTDEQQGVSDKGSNIKGVNICTNTQHPVNNNTNTQHPFNNSTNTPTTNINTPTTNIINNTLILSNLTLTPTGLQLFITKITPFYYTNTPLRLKVSFIINPQSVTTRITISDCNIKLKIKNINEIQSLINYTLKEIKKYTFYSIENRISIISLILFDNTIIICKNNGSYFIKVLLNFISITIENEIICKCVIGVLYYDNYLLDYYPLIDQCNINISVINEIISVNSKEVIRGVISDGLLREIRYFNSLGVKNILYNYSCSDMVIRTISKILKVVGNSRGVSNRDSRGGVSNGRDSKEGVSNRDSRGEGNSRDSKEGVSNRDSRGGVSNSRDLVEGVSNGDMVDGKQQGVNIST
ncbi:hypothetical protein CWI36_2011p0010, partial [Hamiltosporidium magnivora]